MFAVIRTGGKQYVVSPGMKLKIEKLDAAEDGTIEFDDVLLISDKATKIGRPAIEGASVTGKVLGQKRHKKITILKYRAKKRYKKKLGHRQPYTEVEIGEIVSGK